MKIAIDSKRKHVNAKIMAFIYWLFVVYRKYLELPPTIAMRYCFYGQSLWAFVNPTLWQPIMTIIYANSTNYGT